MATTTHIKFGDGLGVTDLGSGVIQVDSVGATGPQGLPTIVQDEGVALTSRTALNFVGAGVTATDDAANTRTLVTIPAGLPADTVVAAATRIIRNLLAAGDTQPSWQVRGDGRMDWGAGGTSASDLALYRQNPGILALGTTSQKGWLQIYGASTSDNVLSCSVGSDPFTRLLFRADGQIAWGPGGTGADTYLYRGAAGRVETAGNFSCGSGYAAGNLALVAFASGDAQYRFIVNNNGLLQWGSGSAGVDSNLYRSTSATLKTDGVMVADHQTSVASVTTARTGGTAAALPSAPVKYLALRDETGARVYVPAYS